MKLNFYSPLQGESLQGGKSWVLYTSYIEWVVQICLEILYEKARACPNVDYNNNEVRCIYTLPTGYVTLTTLPLGKSKMASDRSESE